MGNTVDTMFALLRFILNGEEPETRSFTEEEAKALYMLSKKHDVVHMISYALEKCGFDIPKDVLAAFKKQKITAFYRSGIMEAELERVKKIFNEENIVYVPLKGAVIKKLYPEEWMRTSCDIDILVREEDVEKATTALTEKLPYKKEIRNYHDISMFSESGVHLELHFSIKENMDNIDKLLADVWSYVLDNEGCEKNLSPEFFLFYIIAHMMYHFKGGGCGLRQLMDLYIIRNKTLCDEAILRSCLKECGIETFYNEMCNLSAAWFDKKEHTDISKQAESYILNGGIYGSEDQHIAVKQMEKSGKAGYIAGRIFMPKKDLEILYPSLKKYPFMYPFYTVVRWSKPFNKAVRERIKREVALNKGMKKETVSEISELMNNLGI